MARHGSGVGRYTPPNRHLVAAGGPMDVVVPFTELYPEVINALALTGYPFRFVDVSSSVTAYWDLFAELWDRGTTFAIVEHDMVVSPSALRELASCQAGWCAPKYDYRFVNTEDGRVASLGLAKFTSRFIAGHPNLMAEAEAVDFTHNPRDDELHPRHWVRVSTHTMIALLRAGAVPCWERHQSPEHLRGGSLSYVGAPGFD